MGLCSPLKLLTHTSGAKEPCIVGTSYGCDGDRMWVRQRCRGLFLCGSGRQVACADCTFASGCGSKLRNCSCVKAAPPAVGVALQHPKPPRAQKLAELDALLRLTPCPDTSRCPAALTRVLVMQGAKEDAAFGNLMFSMVINFALYAAHHRFVPLLRFDKRWVKQTMGTAWAGPNGTGALWESFFEPYCPNITAWLLACPQTVRLAPPLTKAFFYPGVQYQFAWPVRQWYNADSPARVACEDGDVCDRFHAPTFADWRLRAHAVARHTHAVNGRHRRMADALWQQFNPLGARPVLAVHMRGSDKRALRKRIRPADFLPYVADFAARWPQGAVYVATESESYAHEVRTVWNASLTTGVGELRAPWVGGGAKGGGTKGGGKGGGKRGGGEVSGSGSAEFRVFLPPIRTRVSGALGNFRGMHDQMEVASDVLLDILMLSRADYLLHGASAVAEAAIYLNPALHWRSTHLEYAHSGCRTRASCHDAPWRWRHSYVGASYS